MMWSDQYDVSGWASSNPNVTKQKTANGTFGLGALQDDQTAHEVYLSAGTFTFEIRLRLPHKVKQKDWLFDKKTITITDVPAQGDLKKFADGPVRFDLKLHR